MPQVELSWDQNRRCDGYEIWRAEGTKAFRQVDTVDDADETEWYDMAVKKGTRYSYRVRGYVEDDNGDPVHGGEGRTVSVTIRKNIKSCTYTAKRTGKNLKITFKKAEGTKCVIQVRYRKSQAWKQVSCKLNKKIVRKVSPKKLQVRIRTAEEIGGKLAYSKWTKVKTVR